MLYDALCLEGNDIIKAMYTHGVRSIGEIVYVMDSLVNGGRTVFTIRSMRLWTDVSLISDVNLFIVLANSSKVWDDGLVVIFATACQSS